MILTYTLNAQGLEGETHEVGFIENDDLVVIKGDPVNRAYVFSRPEWLCKNMIELPKFRRCFIHPKGKLLLLLDLPFLISQWDLETLKLENQYLLNGYLYGNRSDINTWLNYDLTMLVVYGRYQNWDMFYTYSVETGVIMAKRKIDTVLTAIIDRIEFFGTPKKERFLIRGHFPKSFKLTLKMADPYTLQVYSAINLLKHDGHEIEVFTVHQKHIIRVWKNHLFVQELVENLWTEYLRSVIGDNNKIPTFFCGETVKKMLMDTLDNYKSDPESTPKKHTFQGDSISWSVTYHDRFETRRYFALKAHILKHEDKEEESQDNEEKSREPVEISVELPSSHFLLGGSTYFMECKLLESEDFLMITPIGVFIWTIKINKQIMQKNKSIGLLYYWGIYDGTRSRTPQEGIIVNLESIIDADHLKFSINKLLPPPHFNWIVKMRKRSTWYTDYDKGWKGWGTNAPNFQDLLDYYMDDVLFLELYGDVLMCALLQEDDDDLIEAFFKKYLKLSEFQIEDGNLSSFSKLANIIFSSLPKLSEKSFTFVTRLLAHLAFIPSHNFKDSLVSNSDASHLQHCGEYFHLTKTSLINRVNFWISFNYPMFYEPFKFPFSFYHESKAQLTIKLMFPLLNFSTYSKEYTTLQEFIIPRYNSFSFSFPSEVYEWWGLEALVQFKWHTYGRYYYLVMWAIYTAFMCSFTVTVTMSQLSWGTKVILLQLTIFLGIFHLIFEIRRFIHNPRLFMSSYWHWFNLVMILFPICTSFSWLQTGKLPLWETVISTLLLELKFLLYFRAIKYFGTYFAIMIRVAQRVFSFLVVWAIFIFAFAHSLHLLLRPTTVYSDQQSYIGGVNNSWNIASKRQYVSPNDIIENTTEDFDENLTMFSMLYSSFLAVYFMMTGDISLISPSVLAEDWILVLLLVLFSFTTTIYLMNLFIGLLSLAINEANNKQSFLHLRAMTLSEIELFWMLPSQRRKLNWFPDFINYEATVDELRQLVSLVRDKNYASSNPPYLSSSLLEMINMTIKVDTIEGVGLKIDGIEKKINGIEGEVKHMMKSEGVENRFNEFGEDIKNIEEKLNIIMNLVEKLSSSQKDSEDNGNRDEV
ncbi:nudt9 protein [Gigaspora margarita]|uniref:Nudt9 protein n=1 Tax=Gigaspora margarita TaxID=4874 RepID=A0A8H4AZQ0_GIGMA|nr:nudt9 protein [Gigaspora margarita]